MSDELIARSIQDYLAPKNSIHEFLNNELEREIPIIQDTVIAGKICLEDARFRNASMVKNISQLSELGRAAKSIKGRIVEDVMWESVITDDNPLGNIVSLRIILKPKA